MTVFTTETERNIVTFGINALGVERKQYIEIAVPKNTST